MPLVIEPLCLRLRQPFVIAHGASTTRDNVLVRVREGGVEGIGEAAAGPYLGESHAGIVEYLDALARSAPELDPLALAHAIDALPPGSAAARAAVDIALHDAFGKALGQPLYRLLGLDPRRCPPSSFTIAIGTPEQMAAAARAAPLPVLKLKLGGASDDSGGDRDADLARVDAVRAASALPIRVDANAGWSRERAERLLPRLAERGVELCEQPLAAGDLDGLRALARLPRRPPIFADEGIRSSADIVAHAGLVDGVVVKLAKSGGIRGALRDIALARALGLDVLLSCMIESSLAVTAAAHLAPLCRHVDLDGPLLIENDPFEGVLHREGRLVLSERPGLGLVTRD
jgi:L-alanine-DL-glutamate epimerase-like enolase superfamily enzyme